MPGCRSMFRAVKGEKQLWSFEATSPNILLKQGFKRTSMRPGDKIKVTFYPLSDGGPGGSLDPGRQG